MIQDKGSCPQFPELFNRKTSQPRTQVPDETAQGARMEEEGRLDWTNRLVLLRRYRIRLWIEHGVRHRISLRQKEAIRSLI